MRELFRASFGVETLFEGESTHVMLSARFAGFELASIAAQYAMAAEKGTVQVVYNTSRLRVSHDAIDRGFDVRCLEAWVRLVWAERYDVRRVLESLRRHVDESPWNDRIVPESRYIWKRNRKCTSRERNSESIPLSLETTGSSRRSRTRPPSRRSRPSPRTRSSSRRTPTRRTSCSRTSTSTTSRPRSSTA